MRILAWVCFVWAILDMIASIIKTLVTEKTASDRVSQFIVSLLYIMPVCFFYMYLFGR